MYGIPSYKPHAILNEDVGRQGVKERVFAELVYELDDTTLGLVVRYAVNYRKNLAILNEH